MRCEMTSILTYLKSDKKFALYCRDKNIMRGIRSCLVRKLNNRKYVKHGKK